MWMQVPSAKMNAGSVIVLKNQLKTALPYIPMVAAGAVCGVLVACYAERAAENGFPGGMPGALLLLFGGLCLAFFLQTAVHEGGHLLFGLLTGYRFCSYRVGSLMVVRQEGRLRLRRLSVAGTGGQCLMAPPPWSRDLPVALYNLGGCLLNLLCAGLCLALWLPLRQRPVPAALLLICGLAGLVFALLNGIPMRLGGLDNDGRNALNLRKHPQALHAFWLQMKVAECQAGGVRLKDMPAEWFLRPESGLEDPLVAAAAVFGCCRLMDELRLEEAAQAIGTLLSEKTGMAELHRSLLTCDLLCCRLLAGDPKGASALASPRLQRFFRGMKQYPSVLRTRYMLALLLEKDGAAAERLREQFEKCTAAYPYPQELTGERALMELADRAAREGCIP